MLEIAIGGCIVGMLAVTVGCLSLHRRILRLEKIIARASGGLHTSCDEFSWLQQQARK